MLHAGDMDFEMTAKSMTLFGQKVAPHLKDLGSVSTSFGPYAKEAQRKLLKTYQPAAIAKGFALHLAGANALFRPQSKPAVIVDVKKT